MRIVSNQADDAPSDAELMRRLALGRMDALAALVHRHQSVVRAVAFRMTRRDDLADDITQETFLRVHRSAGSYQPTAAFRTWLYRIVSNLCLDRLRSPRLAELTEVTKAPTAPAADVAALAAERCRAVQAAIARLPERQRLAVILHRYEGLSHAQIAESTEWSESAVESLLVRAYGTLRTELTPWKD